MSQTIILYCSWLEGILLDFLIILFQFYLPDSKSALYTEL